MTSPDTFVAIDLETTGLDPQYCEIIEIGAVKVVDGKIVADYSELVKPQKPIPEFITKLTGITRQDVVNAPPVKSVLPSFLDFIRGYRLLGHNVKFDVSFLRKAAGAGNIRAAIDNIELARIVLPRLSSYSLDSLIDFFALATENRHRAFDDARITAVIFLKLIDMLRLMPDHIISDLGGISHKTGSELSEIFDAEQRRRIEQPAAAVTHDQLESGTSDFYDNIYGDITDTLATPVQPEHWIDQEEVAGYFRAEGVLGRHVHGFEERSGQIVLAQNMARAFNDAELLLAEAGTGTGKSLAYLVPSILWAERTRERVVISTNTKNLQEQLFTKDIPLLGKVLDFPFRAVILKGRGNYICLNRWDHLVETPDRFLTAEERTLILPVAAWLQETRSGDLSETGFFSLLGESGLLERINSDSATCKGARCAHREQCFISRVRKAAQRAHVVIVNHSLVFSDMASDGGVLGPYNRIVFDEAHNIEKVALQFLGTHFTYSRVRRILNRLYASRDAGYGYYAVLTTWAADMVKAQPEFTPYAGIIEQGIDAVKALRSTTYELFEHLDASVRSEAESESGKHTGKLRYYEGSEVFTRINEAFTDFVDAHNELNRVITETMNLLSTVPSSLLGQKEDILIDLEEAMLSLQALLEDFLFLCAGEGDHVFWFDFPENGSPRALRILSAPLDVGGKLAAGLYDKIETAVLTSATLAVARDFKYIRRRLGLNLDSRDRVTEFIADSPFDYTRQSVVMIPTFLPSPKSDRYISDSNQVILRIAMDIRRGMLVLFTSWGHLNRAYNELRDSFAMHGITLLAQGVDGSRSHLLHRFRDEPTSVLFGTESFWEGVDVPGNALEVVVISRLPFAVPSDPVVQAMMEEIKQRGGEPFMEYSVPEAAIKLRQGAGRLIRHRSDRGAIIMMDTRVATARYGVLFKRSLPGTSVRNETLDDLVRGLANWFDV